VSAAALDLRGLTATYGRATALWTVDLAVEPGTIAVLLGPNGAGKTTLLKVASGLMRPAAGTVMVAGRDATAMSPNARARLGLCLVPEGRGIFPRLTVRENLRLQGPPCG
jgi:branched-chain amino acid transport system ATP-binding protein